MSHYTLPIRPRTLRRLLAGIAASSVLAATGLGYAGTADATTVDDYFTNLANNGMTVWDYPLMLRQGLGVCQLLYQNVNPYPILVYTTGYPPADASNIIMSAQSGLCPDAAVTGPPPQQQLLEAI